MKGDETIYIYLVVAALVFILILVALPFLSKADRDFQEQGVPKLKEIITYKEGYNFNEEDLFVNPGLSETGYEYFEDTNSEGLTAFCSDFKDAFIKSISSDGKPILIKEIDVVGISPDNSYYDSYYILPGNLSCGDLEIIKEEGDVEREICTINSDFGLSYSDIIPERPGFPFSSYDIESYDSIEYPPTTEYGRLIIRDNDVNYDPYIHGCYIPDTYSEKPYYLDEATSILEIFPSFGFKTYWHLATADLGYSYSYAYQRIKDPSAGYSLRIVLTDADIGDDDKCTYNLFVCMQPSIGKNQNASAYQIFKHFRDVITSDMECCKNIPVGDTGVIKANKKYSHPYIFDFTNEAYKPNLYEILAAIDAGMWEWSRLNYDNKNLIQELTSPMYKTADHIRFAYPTADEITEIAGPFNLNDPAAWGVYPDCVPWSDYPEYLEFSKTGRTTFYSKIWGHPYYSETDLEYKQYYGGVYDPYNTDYDKLSITTTFTYDFAYVIKLDETKPFGWFVEEKILIITPHIGICRDR